jgi:hypothetical protein
MSPLAGAQTQHVVPALTLAGQVNLNAKEGIGAIKQIKLPSHGAGSLSAMMLSSTAPITPEAEPSEFLDKARAIVSIVQPCWRQREVRMPASRATTSLLLPALWLETKISAKEPSSK